MNQGVETESHRESSANDFAVEFYLRFWQFSFAFAGALEAEIPEPSLQSFVPRSARSTLSTHIKYAKKGVLKSPTWKAN